MDTIGVLAVDQLVGARDQEFRTAEALEDQQLLGVAGHPLIGKPGAKGRLVTVGA